MTQVGNIHEYKSLGLQKLTHGSHVMDICVKKLTNIGLGNGLSPKPLSEPMVEYCKLDS